MIDFHSHILPCIDDGAKTPGMSVEMLKQAAEQGIDTIIATPHFNFDEIELEIFLEKRSHSLQLVKEEAEKAGIISPEIIPGAEVYLLPGTADRKDLSKLCIEGTNCLLVEMPVGRWTGWVFNEIYKMRDKDIVPVMAHLERYISDKENTDKIHRLLEMEVCVQINADDLLKFRYRKIIGLFAKMYKVVVLGSDSHDSVKRPNRVKKGLGVLKKRFGEGFVRELERNAETLVFDEFVF